MGSFRFAACASLSLSFWGRRSRVRSGGPLLICACAGARRILSWMHQRVGLEWIRVVEPQRSRTRLNRQVVLLFVSQLEVLGEPDPPTPSPAGFLEPVQAHWRRSVAEGPPRGLPMPNQAMIRLPQSGSVGRPPWLSATARVGSGSATVGLSASGHPWSCPAVRVSESFASGAGPCCL